MELGLTECRVANNYANELYGSGWRLMGFYEQNGSLG